MVAFFLRFSVRFLEIIYWSFVCLPFLTLIISIALLWRGGQVVTSIMLVVITSFIDILFQQVPKSFMPRNCMVWRLPLSMARCNIRCWMILNFNLIEFDRLAFLKGAWYWGLLPLQYRYPVWTCPEVVFGSGDCPPNKLTKQCHIIHHRSTRVVRGCTPLMSAVVARLV